MTSPIHVVHNEPEQRFEAIVDGRRSFASYRREGDVLYMVHTEVPREQRGSGIAAAVVQGAMDYAQAHGLKVAPVCSYVRAYLRRHPETASVAVPGYAS